MWGETNRRGVSEVLGAILVFAILVSGVAVYQVTVVPQTNEEREIEHSQQVRSGMQDLRNDIQEASFSGQRLSTSLEMGPSYPVRSLTLNPPEGAGTLRTVDTGDPSVTLDVENAVAVDDETADWWTGTTRTFPTGTITYTPDYNYYDDAPVTGYDNSVLYERFAGSTEYLAQTDQDVVEGRRISLTTLDGEQSVSRTGSITLETRPVSPATETVTVEGGGGPVRITLRTALPESFWVEELLAGQIDDTGDGAVAPEDGDRCGDFSATPATSGDGRYVVDCVYTENPNELDELTLVLQRQENGQPVRYELATSKVGLGSGVTTPDAKYLTDTEGSGADVPIDGRQKVVFQVRDRYNNPATDVTLDVSLDASASDEGTLYYRGADIGASATDLPVDTDGELELVYDAPSSTTTSPVAVDIEASFSGTAYGANDPESALVEMEVINASRIDRTEPLLNPAENVIVDSATATRPSTCGGGDDCQLELTLRNLASSEVEVTDIRYSFYSADSQGSAPTASGSRLEIRNPSQNVGDGPVGLADDYVELDPSITLAPSGDAGDSVTMEFIAYEDSGDTLDIDEGEFMVVSAIIDGERKTFFVAPEVP